jgi:hypothetical protein
VRPAVGCRLRSACRGIAAWRIALDERRARRRGRLTRGFHSSARREPPIRALEWHFAVRAALRPRRPWPGAPSGAGRKVRRGRAAFSIDPPRVLRILRVLSSGSVRPSQRATVRWYVHPSCGVREARRGAPAHEGWT